MRLARIMAGPDASTARVTSIHKQIVKWVKGKPGISDENAVRIARAFNTLTPGRYEDSHFLKEPDREPSWAEEMANLMRLRQRDLRTYRAELRKLREQIEKEREQMAQELEVTRQEVEYELDRLRRAS